MRTVLVIFPRVEYSRCYYPKRFRRRFFRAK